MSASLLASEGFSQIELIARSERGEIYGALDQTGQAVAIRLFSNEASTSASASDSVMREARGGVRLHHPHVVRLIATGQREGRQYLVMERVDGGCLGQRVVEQGALCESEAVTVLSQMAQALGYAWRVGVAHRDVRPGNVLLAPARLGVSEPFCAKLSNFGLSRLRQVEDTRRSHAAIERDDLRGLASTICWTLTPNDHAAQASPADSTLRLERVSLETMQLLSHMLDAQRTPPSWSQVVERARHLPGGVPAR